jgi:hypothetical protein
VGKLLLIKIMVWLGKKMTYGIINVVIIVVYIQ